ncbi:MAG: hypothetical protein AMS21_11170 [Gemmatimonas sp. SG8_38_2]|nr:MAG: hypothetical protein AMS21_11170 [Gemmatimonas sp. SG8_38_2]
MNHVGGEDRPELPIDRPEIPVVLEGDPIIKRRWNQGDVRVRRPAPSVRRNRCQAMNAVTAGCQVALEQSEMRYDTPLDPMFGRGR